MPRITKNHTPTTTPPRVQPKRTPKAPEPSKPVRTGDPVLPDRFETAAESAVRFLPRHGTPAENFVAPLEAGCFDLPKRGGLGVKGMYFDFAVANFAFDKKIAVTVRLTRADGTVEEFMVRPQHKGSLPDGREKWGADLAVFHDSGPHGPVADVSFDYTVLADGDGDGKRDYLASSFVYRAATGRELAEGTARGKPSPAGSNARTWNAVDLSRLDEAARRLASSKPPTEVYFSPGRGCAEAVMREIDAVIAAKRADPSGRHYIHASVYNINSAAITDKLLDAHRAGVEIKLLTSGPQMQPDRPWEVHYRRLQDAGVEVVGVMRDGVCNSNHTKIANFDGKVAITGSFNWEDGAESENFENLVVLRSPDAALVYEGIFQAVAGGEPRAANVGPAAGLEISYSQAGDALGNLIDRIERAKDSITLAQFQVRDARDERGRSLVDALGRAAERGVEVTLITDKRIADGGEYHGTIQADDPTDERLARRGVKVVEVLNPHGEYASMHHKFAVFDERVAVTGSYNWWAPSESSDDDFVAIDDQALAQAFLGEARNLRSRFDPGFDRAAQPKARMELAIEVPHTRPGEEVYLVGDVPELGSWDPKKGVRLDGSGWPTWKGSVEIPAGVAFKYKFVIRGPHGDRWEGGPDRSRTADPMAGRSLIKEAFSG